mgnify:CR=1 FL=1
MKEGYKMTENKKNQKDYENEIINKVKKENDEKQILIEDGTMAQFGFTNPSEFKIKNDN